MKSDGSKILLAFVAGAAAGVVAGLLLAPDSGANTRAKLAQKAKDLESDLEDTIKEQFATIKGQISNLTSKIANNKVVEEAQSVN